MAISDAQYQAWLESPSEERNLLVEASYFDGTDNVEYMSTRGYITASGDAPASTPYDDVIKAFPLFRRSMQEAFTGKTQQSFGDIEISNESGDRDAWLERSWNGRDILLLFGDPAWDYADYRTILAGSIAELTAKSIDTLVLKLRDKGVFLEKQMQTSVFSTGSNINRTLPVCYGQVKKIAPILEDSTTHKYKIHDGEISSIDAVYDKGVSISFTANLADGSFTLSSQPSGQITADVKGGVIATINDDPASTNILLHSGDAGDVVWVKISSTATEIIGAAPDGVSSTFEITSDGLGSFPRVEQIITSGGTVAYSAFVKDVDSGECYIRIEGTGLGGGADTFSTYKFDFTTKLLTNRSGYAGATTTVVDYGNGDYRLSMSMSSTTITRAVFYPRFNDTVVASVYFWGAQLEQQSAPTEYIPTTTTSITRPLTEYKNDIASISWDIIKNRSDLLSTDMNVENFQIYHISHPQIAGIYIDGKDKHAAVLDKLVSSIGGWWGFDRDGKITLGQLVDPDGETAVLTLVSDDIIQGGMAIKRRQLPSYKVTVGHTLYQKTQGANDVAGSITEAEIADLVQPFRLSTAVDTTVRNAHLLSHETAIINTQLASSTEAATEASRRLALSDTLRTVYNIDAFSTPFSINLGDVIEIQHDRFGFDAGENAIVVGYSESVTPPRIKLEVWKKSIKLLPALFGFFGVTDIKGFGTATDFSQGGVFDES